ncbi:response regulator transcription factor [Aquabacter sp. CN5-332]|uniref:response regulator transcription factor n=1 Tax=Aquabacter sp. CN5-332 TaxID=3156608 RepID=UPI0032B513F8
MTKDQMTNAPDKIRVVLVEDEADLRDTLCRFLREVGMNARGIGCANDLWPELKKDPADIVVLDVNLPGESGFTVAARLRAASNIGIVLMTARSPKEDRLLGLSIGADHYLVKPVEPEELELLIRNLHKRLMSSLAPVAETWTFNAKSWTLITPTAQSIQVSKAEFSILTSLMERPGTPVSRDQLRILLNASDQQGTGRSVDTVIYRLRRRIALECQANLPIHTARGIGYVFVADAELTNK